MYGLKRCEIGISKQELNELKNSGKLGDREVDGDFAWLLISLAEEKHKNDDDNEVNDNDNEIEDEDGNEYGDEEDDDEDEDEKDIDPQYRMFLENLTENGRSYKLNISQNVEEPDYLEYEKEEQSDGFDDLQAYMYDNGNKATSSKDQRVKRRLAKTIGDTSIQEEVSRKKKKINEQKSITEPNKDIVVERDYARFLKTQVSSNQFDYHGQMVNYEDDGARDSDTDSDVLIVENVQACNQVDKIQKRSSLKEQLIDRLQKPYSKKEHVKLSEWIKKKMPICRHLDLRDRPVSVAVDGAVKSVLDDGPGSFQLKLKAAKAQKDDYKHLNLLRMFRFWLTKLPNENIFQPWLDEDIMNVLPARTVIPVQDLPNENMLQPS
ncbi:hypothetical protein Tco_1354620 [Tanacetum coccineum]